MQSSTEIQELRDLSYHPLHPHDSKARVDLYVPGAAVASGTVESRRKPVIVFIHGGAWRTNDRAEFVDVARRLVERTGCIVAVPGYRLSLPAEDPGRPMHPSHIQDVHAALQYIATEAERGSAPAALAAARGRPFVLVGHSAGAHIGAWIALCGPNACSGAKIAPLNVVGAVLVDGIFDVADLAAEYPDCAGFIAQAFGDDSGESTAESSAWARASVVPLARRPDRAAAERLRAVLVLHSRQDELLSLRQPEQMIAALREGFGAPPPLTEQAGASKRAAAATVVVETDFESVGDKHDALLHTAAFAARVAKFMSDHF